MKMSYILSMKELAKIDKKAQAIELLALSPDVKLKDIAEKLEIAPETLSRWKRDPQFVDAIYDRYMVEFGSELPHVLKAMIREAKSGNVQAGRLVLEHSGKLVKNVNHTLDSPFDKWLKQNVVDGEIVNEEALQGAEITYEELPPRKEENVAVRAKTEHRKLREAAEKSAYNAKQREWYNWKKRAKDAGVEPLPARRPTKGQREDWIKEIIAKEKGIK